MAPSPLFSLLNTTTPRASCVMPTAATFPLFFSAPTASSSTWIPPRRYSAFSKSGIVSSANATWRPAIPSRSTPTASPNPSTPRATNLASNACSKRCSALATIVHTKRSIPSYESSRMLVREDGSLVGAVGGGCVEADVWAAAKEVMQKESPRKMVFNLNNEASYDNGLNCGGTVEIFVEPILPQPVVYLFGGGHVSLAMAKATSSAGFAIGAVGRL